MDNKKILIVEDNPMNQFLTQKILEKNNFNIFIAENGQVACEEIKNNTGQYSIILMDLMMPVMNGFEFLKKIRETELNSIPILVLTGAELSEDEKTFLSGETHRILEKSDDTLSTIVNEVGNVLKASAVNGDNK